MVFFPSWFRLLSQSFIMRFIRSTALSSVDPEPIRIPKSSALDIMTQEEKTKIEEKIVDVLKTVYDPEIPVNIWDLGMIYKIDVKDDATVELDMTFTAPSCPAADFILEDVRSKVDSVEGVKSANVNLVFEPAWDQSMMSEEARVELGFE